MNSRTVVPLRFIAESLGLTVKWDAEERIIEIDETTEEAVTEETITEKETTEEVVQ